MGGAGEAGEGRVKQGRGGCSRGGAGEAGEGRVKQGRCG